MKQRFLDFFLALIQAATGKDPQKATPCERRRISRTPEFIRAAKEAGDARRLAAHRRSCLQAYLAKIARANRPGSRHTTLGIPEQYLSDTQPL